MNHPAQRDTLKDMTEEEAAAIQLYTQETGLYRACYYYYGFQTFPKHSSVLRNPAIFSLYKTFVTHV